MLHFHADDQYRHEHTLLHLLDARVKVALTLAFILTASLIPAGRFELFALLWLLVLAAVIVARIGVDYVLRRSVVALPFALAAVTLPFTIAGQTLITLPLFGGLDVSLEGTVRFLTIVVKSWLSLQMAIVLVSVTPFAQLIWGLHALRVPPLLVTVVSFAYRYLFVLSDEVLRLVRARAARSGERPGLRSGGSLAWRGQVAGRMAGSLMVRSFERSERIYNAMAARGYQGQIRLLSRPQLHRRDGVTLAAILLFLVTTLAVGYL
jgi:cobalt/nickel transport system permease protein